MVLNATFNNISAISRRSVLLVEETGVLGENQLHVVVVNPTTIRPRRPRIDWVRDVEEILNAQYLSHKKTGGDENVL
jgi:hypothetical protein